MYQACNDGMERRAAVDEIVKEKALQRIFLKPPGFGAKNKVSTAKTVITLIADRGI